MKETEEKVWRRKENVIGREIAGEFLLVPVTGNLASMQALFALNPVGRLLWESLDGKTRIEEVRRKVVERFDVTDDEAARDIAEFIVRLDGEGLVAHAL